MATAGVVYCVDTSSLIHAWARAYPPQRFPGLWAAFDDLIEAGRMVASIEVYNELQKKDDDVFAWAKERKDALFRDIDDDTQSAVITVMAKYPKLVDTSTGKSGGDPFVIAQAIALGSSCCVVTQEVGGSDRSPKIPYVCRQEGIDCINLLDMIQREQWTF